MLLVVLLLVAVHPGARPQGHATQERGVGVVVVVFVLVVGVGAPLAPLAVGADHHLQTGRLANAARLVSSVCSSK